MVADPIFPKAVPKYISVLIPATYTGVLKITIEHTVR
jgi:hypothetical protein